MRLGGLGVPGPKDLLRLAEGGYEAIEQAIALVPRVVSLLGEVEGVVARAKKMMDDIDRTQRSAGAAIGQAQQVLQHAEQLVDRADTLVGRADTLLDRTAGVLDATQPLLKRADAVLGQTQPLLTRAGKVLDETEPLAKQAGELVATTGPLAELAGPLMQQAGDLVGRAGGLLDGAEPSLRSLQPMLDRLAQTTSPAEVDAVVQFIDTLPELVQAMRDDVLPIVRTLGTVAPDVRDLLDTTKEFSEILGSLPGLGRIKRRVEERQEQEDFDRLAKDDPPRSPDEVR
jgi:ABC-type transporter Mla subunit MlaD